MCGLQSREYLLELEKNLLKSQNDWLQESCDQLQRKLAETEKMLGEERERNKINMKSTEILAKVW